MNWSRNKGGAWIKCSVELNRNIWHIFQEIDIHKLYLMISRKLTSRHEAATLGIHLGISRDNVTYYVLNHDVRDATYRFLRWAKDNCRPVEMWQRIIEALRTLGKNTTIIELELENNPEVAKRKVNVIVEGKNGNCFK